MKGTAMAAAMLFLAVAISGCDSSRPVARDPQILVGRYQFIGKQVYPDGTVEYACLDTATGSIGYAAIYPDTDKRRTLTNFDCSN